MDDKKLGPEFWTDEPASDLSAYYWTTGKGMRFITNGKSYNFANAVLGAKWQRSIEPIPSPEEWIELLAVPPFPHHVSIGSNTADGSKGAGSE